MLQPQESGARCRPEQCQIDRFWARRPEVPEAGASGYAKSADQFQLELPFSLEFSQRPVWLRYQPVFA